MERGKEMLFGRTISPVHWIILEEWIKYQFRESMWCTRSSASFKGMVSGSFANSPQSVWAVTCGLLSTVMISDCQRYFAMLSSCTPFHSLLFLQTLSLWTAATPSHLLIKQRRTFFRSHTSSPLLRLANAHRQISINCIQKCIYANDYHSLECTVTLLECTVTLLEYSNPTRVRQRRVPLRRSTPVPRHSRPCSCRDYRRSRWFDRTCFHWKWDVFTAFS